MALINRYSTTQRGSMIFTGNTLGLGDGNNIVVFTTIDTTQQVPGFPPGTTQLWQNDSSSAQLNIPLGSTVLYAELQWGGSEIANSGGDVSAFVNQAINFTTPLGTSSIAPDPTTSQTFTFNGSTIYSRSNNVTALIQAAGSGTYTVAGVPATYTPNLNANNCAGWTLGIIYSNPALPMRNMTIYSGLAGVATFQGGQQVIADIPVSGFLAPPVNPVIARVLLSAMEGDPGILGDRVAFGVDTSSLVDLYGPNNLVNNFFASQINNGNSESSSVGLLDTSGTFGNLNPTPGQFTSGTRYGWDITNVSVINFEKNQSSGVLRLYSQGDLYGVPLVGIQLDTVGFDFGDAPDTGGGNTQNNYSTLLASNGPYHRLDYDLTLGTQVTQEEDAYQNPTATGDDLIQVIQDDGLVTPVNSIITGDNTYTLNVSYVNNTGETAYLYGWVDFNMNGIFELEEAAPLGILPYSGNALQKVNLTFTIPDTSTIADGDVTFIRLRLTNEALYNTNVALTSEDTRSLGPALNGEVEDYIVEAISLNVDGIVWYDLNCNGVIDPGESAVAGTVVELFSTSDPKTPVRATVTDANGAYSFTDLPSGEYYVVVVKPNGYNFTVPNVGNDPLINSNVSKSTGQSANFTLNEENPEEIVNAGLCKCFNISGNTFYDCNRGGVFEGTSPILCGVIVTLKDSLGLQIGRTLTDCNGFYQFNCIKSGSYTVEFVAPASMVNSPQNTIYYGSKPAATTGIATVTVSNADVLNIFAGFYGNTSQDLQYCYSCLNFD